MMSEHHPLNNIYGESQLNFSFHVFKNKHLIVQILLKNAALTISVRSSWCNRIEVFDM